MTERLPHLPPPPPEKLRHRVRRLWRSWRPAKLRRRPYSPELAASAGSAEPWRLLEDLDRR